jgi:hypothetical protein
MSIYELTSILYKPQLLPVVSSMVGSIIKIVRSN